MANTVSLNEFLWYLDAGVNAEGTCFTSVAEVVYCQNLFPTGTPLPFSPTPSSV